MADAGDEIELAARRAAMSGTTLLVLAHGGEMVAEFRAAPGPLARSGIDLSQVSLVERIHPDDLPRVMEAFQDVRDGLRASARVPMSIADATGAWYRNVFDVSRCEHGVVLAYRPDEFSQPDADVLSGSLPALAAALPDTVLLLDQQRRLVFANGAARELFGWSPDEAVRDAEWWSTFADDGRTEALDAVNAVLTEGASSRRFAARTVDRAHPSEGPAASDGRAAFEGSVGGGSHDVRWLDVFVTPLSGDARVVGVVLAARDVTERHQAEQRLQRFVGALHEGAAVCTRSGQIETVNDAFTRMTGATPNVALADTSGGRTLREVLETRMGDDEGRPLEPHELPVTGGSDRPDGPTYSDGIVRSFDHPDGRRRWYLVTTSAIDDDDRHLVTLSDVTATWATAVEYRSDATSDPLTGLPNRRLMIGSLTDSVERAEAGIVSVTALFVDLDSFKPVNDTYGHAAGDRVLIEAAERIRAAVRPNDLVGRVGGDEFIVIVEHDPAPDGHLSPAETDVAHSVARRIVEAMSAPFDVKGTTVEVGASVGLARHRPDDGAGQLLDRADHALYRSKRAGGGTVTEASPDDDPS